MSDDERVKITNNLEGENRSMQVVLWDKGPDKPTMPKRPVPPPGKEGTAEYDLAMVEFREQIEDYEKALRAYRKDKHDYEHFMEKYGGPFEFVQWSVDAADTLQRDPDRFTISSRTRGYEKLRNGGLPIGLRPGPGHEENMRRLAQNNADLVEAMRQDPVFGQEIQTS